MGDAVNWEWVVACAISSGKDIVIVSRDSDYGEKYGGKRILNDWLTLEFRERVSRRRRLVLTEELSEAFKLVKVKVSEAAQSEEKELLETLNATAHAQAAAIAVLSVAGTSAVGEPSIEKN